jgi:hypothetical protein
MLCSVTERESSSESCVMGHTHAYIGLSEASKQLLVTQDDSDWHGTARKK